MTKIIVGVDDSSRSQDAVVLASRLARAASATLLLARAYRYEDYVGVMPCPGLREDLEDLAETTLEKMRRFAQLEDVETVALACTSPARALHELAERTGAALIVVGSTHTGRLGRVLPGSTGERLVHGSPCAVAVAPRGYATHTSAEIAVIGCGFDGSETSKAALDTATDAARLFDAQLRVIEIHNPGLYGGPILAMPSYIPATVDLEGAARERLAQAVRALPADVRAEAVFAVGNPVRRLADQSHDVDLLVLGARGYGSLHAVLAGGVSGPLLREAACPVIVLPRGTERPLGELFAKSAEVTTMFVGTSQPQTNGAEA
jgi:nucleotide-binding universal stress UspA family protein